MKIGTVLGSVRLQSCAPGYEEILCKQVRLDDQVLVAADFSDTKPGDLVVLTEGESANGYRMDLRCDALILGKVDK